MTTHTDVEKFLQAVFGSDYGTRAVFANLNPPDHKRDFRQLDPNRDCYWSIAAFPPDVDITNHADNMSDIRALVVDDVGTKGPSAGAVEMALGRPTTIVETSPGNFQWGYRLSKPVAKDDWDGFYAGIEALIGHSRPLEARAAQTLMRLPMGVNTKPQNKRFVVRLVSADGSIVMDPDTIVRVKVAKPGTSSEAVRVHNIKAMIAQLPNDIEYDAWIEIGQRIKALAPDEDGREAWHEFSSRTTLKVYDYNYTEWKWTTFTAERTAGGLLLDAVQSIGGPAVDAWWQSEAGPVFDDGEVAPDPNVSPPKPKPKGITATLYKWVELDKTTPRDWLYGDILIRKFISMTVAPGGVGKSSLVAVETLAQVTGRNLLGEEPIGELRVWLWNLEDPYTETQLRIQAAAKHYGISEHDLGERLFVDSGRDQRLVMAEMVGSSPKIVRPVVGALVEQIKLRGIDVVVIDPFVSCHGVPENDNMAQDMVVKEWGRVAEEGNCAVHLVDHTRKAGADAEVTTESSRGAKAKTDAARVVRVVNRMSAVDSRTYGIAEPWRYFNTFNDKANMAPPKAKRDWFRMESLWAGNGASAAQAFSVGAAAVRSQGDSVGVAVQWEPPSAKAMAAGDAFTKVVKAMGTKRWRNEPRSPDWIGNAVALGLQMGAPSISDKVTIKTILKTWISEGLLRVSAQLDENRKMKDYIEIAQVF